MRIKSWKAAAIGLLLIGGCQSEEDANNFVIHADPELILEQREAFGESPKEIILEVSTINLFPCTDNEILFNQVNRADLFMIDFLEIALSEQENCQLESSAKSIVNLGVLASGTYPISINFGEDILDTAILVVNETSISWEQESNLYNGFMAPDKTINRIADNFVWGYLASDNADRLNSSLLEFYSSVGVHTQNASRVEDGDYGYFYLENGDLTPDFFNATPSLYTSFYFHLNEGEETEFLQKLDDYRTTLYSQDELVLFHSNSGEL